MLKKLKHGFTLVELVIVIAVIAVLAAVLIPTFITVIDNANNSADLQLTRNMNTVLSTEVYADQTATAENLRKLLKDNGLNNLTTKKKDNIIAYHQSANKFELINLSKANITTEELSTGTAATVEADVSTDGALVIDPNPFSFAEIFKDYTIVSTGGNEFAESIYKCSSSSKSVMEEGLKWICNSYPNAEQREAFRKSFQKISGYMVATSFMLSEGACTGTTAFVIRENGNLVLKKYVMSFQSGNFSTLFSVDNIPSLSPWTSADKIFISEDITELDLSIFDGKGAVVVLPNTVENVTITNPKTADLSKSLFVGNTQVLHEYAKDEINKDKDKTEEEVLCNAQVGAQKIHEMKESIKEFGSLIHETEFYLVAEGNQNAGKDHYYTDIHKALQDVGNSAHYSGINRDLIVASNCEIKDNIEIPAGVTLQVPYWYGNGMYYTGYGSGHANGEGKSTESKIPIFGSENKIVDDQYFHYSKTYKQFELTIAQNATVTVGKGGGLVVGGVLSHHNQASGALLVGYQGHTSGYYGQINNKGSIVVEDGGRLESNGYIKCVDGGTVTANKGSTVIEPLVLTDFRDTSGSALICRTQGASPFYGYSVMNINSLLVNAGAKVQVRIALAPGSSNQYSDEHILIGYDLGDKGKTDDGLLILKTEASSVKLEYSYNATKGVGTKGAIKDESVMNLKGDIGVTKMTFNGEVDTGHISISEGAFVLDTKQALFPIPYNFEYEINGTFNVYNRFTVLPGAQVKVNKDGTLNVTSGTEFYVADFFRQEVNETKYPTAEQLEAAGYDKSGVLIVNGIMNVAANAKVGGIVRSEQADATLKVDANANVEGKFIEGGFAFPLLGGSEWTNASVYASPLRILVGSTLTPVDTKGQTKTYQSTGTSTTTATEQVKMAYLAKAPDDSDTVVGENKSEYYVDFFEAQKDSILKDSTIKGIYNKHTWYGKIVQISVDTLGWTEQSA